MTDWNLSLNDVVVIRAYEDIPEHLFQVWEIHDDCITGYAITGTFAGEYGEPDFDLILRVHSRSQG